MATLPPIRKLYLEDYASQKNWIGKLLIILNQFITSVVNALDKSLTIVENTTGDIKRVTLSKVPSASSVVGISWTKINVPTAVIVGNVVPTSGTLVLSSAVQVQWVMSTDNKSLNLTNIVGITPSQTNQYTLTLICIAG